MAPLKGTIGRNFLTLKKQATWASRKFVQLSERSSSSPAPFCWTLEGGTWLGHITAMWSGKVCLPRHPVNCIHFDAIAEQLQHCNPGDAILGSPGLKRVFINWEPPMFQVLHTQPCPQLTTHLQLRKWASGRSSHLAERGLDPAVF